MRRIEKHEKSVDRYAFFVFIYIQKITNGGIKNGIIRF